MKCGSRGQKGAQNPKNIAEVIFGRSLTAYKLQAALAGPLDGEGEPAVAGVPRVDVEGVVRVRLALLQRLARHLDLEKR